MEPQPHGRGSRRHVRQYLGARRRDPLLKRAGAGDTRQRRGSRRGSVQGLEGVDASLYCRRRHNLLQRGGRRDQAPAGSTGQQRLRRRAVRGSGRLGSGSAGETDRARPLSYQRGLQRQRLLLAGH